ncbi:MAG TPA: ECF-type sigma factor [Rubricoccaceae bacterium]|jgi:RNA polymerase sigma factor (TIGR02999 family)|nr:ECF-type sigma factor [Rubricoccaceae bacterium]
MEARQGDVTQALLAAAGDAEAAERLWALVYDGLRRIAHRELLRERRDHTLMTTALVHEAYLRLVDDTRISWRDRAHFYALACRAMRHILVDYARQRNAQKRRGRQHEVPLEEALGMASDRSEDLIALDEALDQLAARDARLGQVVECKFFGGLSSEETAEVMGTSLRTVERDWSRARAYLYQALRADPSPEPNRADPGGRP